MAENKRGLFDIFNSLSKTKQLEEGDEELYEPYMTNKIFSHHPETLFNANHMNLYNMLPIKAQLDYYLYSTSSKQRFSKWFKPPVSPDIIKDIQLQLGCSKSEAIHYLELLETLGVSDQYIIKKGGITK